MKKKMLVAGLIVAVPLALAAVLISHPTLARGDETKAQGMEVRIDNFVFTPDTITVPVNSALGEPGRYSPRGCQ